MTGATGIYPAMPSSNILNLMVDVLTVFGIFTDAK